MNYLLVVVLALLAIWLAGALFLVRRRQQSWRAALAWPVLLVAMLLFWR